MLQLSGCLITEKISFLLIFFALNIREDYFIYLLELFGSTFELRYSESSRYTAHYCDKD